MNKNENFKTVNECAEFFIREYPSKTNNEIAQLVRDRMNSDTTTGCIAWYKTKMKNNNNSAVEDMNELTELVNLQNSEEEEVVDYDIKQFDNEAEAYFYNYIKNEYDDKIKKMDSGVGYDYKLKLLGNEMHVEVKGKDKGKISWLQLTSRETEALLNDPLFALALVDLSADGDKRISIIQRTELLQLTRIKLHARLNGLSAEIKREDWDIGKYS